MAGDVLTWIDTLANSFLMDNSTAYSGASWAATVGRQGFFAAPVQLVTVQTPQLVGVTERYLQTVENLLSVPMYLHATSESNLATGRRKFMQATDPRKGVGTLRNTAADGVARQVAARVVAGREGDEGDTMRWPGHLLLDLIFQASDPFWRDTADTTSTPGTATSFNLTNGGDLDTYPVFTLSGPSSGALTQVVLTNTTTGDALTFAFANPGVTFNSGKTLVIDCAQQTITLTGVAGTVAFTGLSDASVLWKLIAGVNAVTAAYTGGGTGFSLAAAWRQKYEGV